MKQKLLLTLLAACVLTAADAQKTSSRNTAYVITSPEGGNGWSEVKLVDLITGETIKSIYESDVEVQALNARTKEAIPKQDMKPQKKIVVLPAVGNNAGKSVAERTITVYAKNMIRTDLPFASYAAACAYDKKNERLYYTPMGINELRYIDLKTNAIYYFVDEPLGPLSGRGDVQNQIARMVIGADGNGYALTNNGEHLIRFNTNKKGIITDLGSLTDEAANGINSIHSKNGYGGDMVADEFGNLYVITAAKNVFKVNIDSKIASYKGSIKGLPEGYTTNAAAVGKGNIIIVSSASEKKAYYKFELGNLQAEKISTSQSVLNASDFANASLISINDDKKPIAEEQLFATSSKVIPADIENNEQIAVYPNPVTTGATKISFTNYAAGKYELQLVDINGKLISKQSLILNNKIQVQEYKLPASAASGTYLLKVLSNKNIINTEIIIVE